MVKGKTETGRNYDAGNTAKPVHPRWNASQVRYFRREHDLRKEVFSLPSVGGILPHPPILQLKPSGRQVWDFNDHSVCSAAAPVISSQETFDGVDCGKLTGL